MNRFHIITLLLILQVGMKAQTKKCWPNFRGDAALTGFTVAELPKTLKLIWTYNGGDQFKGSPVACDNHIVVPSIDGTIHALNLAGEKQWSFKSENGFEAPPMIHNKKVFIGDMSGVFYALNLMDGSLLWQFKTDGQIMGSANVYHGREKDIVLFGSYDFNLYALDAANGALLWTYASDNFINGAPSCLNGNVVFGGCDGFLHVVDIVTGKMQKKVDVTTYVAGSSALSGDFAYTGDYDGRFSCVDLSKQGLAWQWEDKSKNLPFIASPSVAGGRVLAGCRDKFLYCFNAVDGSLLWKFNTGSRVDASPVIDGKSVLVCNMRGDVITVNLEDGSPQKTYELGVAISATPAVLEGKIIVAAEDGNVYCLGE